MSAAQPNRTPFQGENAKPSNANQRTIPPNTADGRNQETVLPTQHDSVPGSGNASVKLDSEFGRYRILECLGQGAMGTVYKARDTQLDRVVALKVPKFSAQSEPELLERFHREARSAATLTHPHICPIYDVGEHNGTHYISMGYIEGRPLAAFIKPGKPQPEAKAASVVRKLAQALEEAHRQGIVHRDVKPENVMVDRRGQPVIMDFGLAYQSKPNSIRATLGGVLLGTPAYMSPEQVDGDLEQIGPASDVYGLGVMFYELLTGELPYQGTLTSVLAQIIKGEPIPPSVRQNGIDPRLEAICLKMMASDRSQRYQSMTDVVRDLTLWQKGETGAAGHSAGPRAASRQEAEDELAVEFQSYEADPRPRREAQRSVAKSHAPTKRARRSKPKPWYQTPWAMWTGVGLTVFVLLLGVVLFVRVGDQTVKIEIDDPSAQVFVNGEQVTITNLGATVELKPGEHNLEVRRGDVVVQTDKFEVIKGNNPILKIHVVKPAEEPKIAKADPQPQDVTVPPTNHAPVQQPPATTDANPATTPLNPMQKAPDTSAVAKADAKPATTPPNRNPREATQAAPPEAGPVFDPGESKDPKFQVMEWAIKRNGRVFINTSLNRGAWVTQTDEIPASSYKIMALTLPPDTEVPLDYLKLVGQLKTLNSVDMQDCGITDEGLQYIAQNSQLLELRLRANPLTDAGIKHLQDLKSLTMLWLEQTQATNIGAQHLAKLSRLEWLDLDGTQVDDEALETLAQLKNLKILDLSGTGITDAAASRIKTMRSLETLYLSRTKITDETLKTLAGHKTLTLLQLGDTKVTDAGLASLAQIEQLESLDLERCDVTDAGVSAHLTKLKKLRILGLAGTKLTDQGLDALSQLPNINYLTTDGTAVTPAGDARFREARPRPAPPRGPRSSQRQ
jgi:serine/threonine protein kinase